LGGASSKDNAYLWLAPIIKNGEMKTHQQPKISVEEYIQLERESDTRYEYRDGDLFAPAGGTLYFDIEGLG
jgi:hypothetical protein